MKSLTIHHEQLVDPSADTSLPDPHQSPFSLATFGFWIYLMSDCLLFAALFASYIVLKNSVFDGPKSYEIFELPNAFLETIILLISSVSCGFGMLATLKKQKTILMFWFLLTFLLGAFFLFLELREFTLLINQGYSFTRSAFLSAFFTLVGVHGIHISVGLLWLAVMIGQIYFLEITYSTFRRLVIFSLFWHFLDLVWVFIFTFVYLFGVIR